MDKSYFDQITNRENTNCVKYDLREKIFKNDDIIPLWVADMDFEAPAFIKNAFHDRIDHNLYGYTFRNNEFSNSVKRWMSLRHNWQIENDWVGFSPGIVPAINFCVKAFTEPGDKIIVQPPVYFPFFSAIRDHNRIMIENELINIDGKYRMDFDNLVDSIDDQVKMIFLCSPHNPVGRVWEKNELEKLCEICLQKNILIISDEIHHDLIFEGSQHIPTASISEDISNISITCIAPSKTFNVAGLSSSAIIISNDKLRDKFTKELSKYHIEQGNVFGNIALQSAYNMGEEYVDQLMLYLADNKKYVEDFLAEELPVLELINAEATYLLWIDFSKTEIPQKKLNDILINEARIGLSDGRLFGRGGTGYQRINIATQKAVLKEAMNRLKIIKNYIKD